MKRPQREPKEVQVARINAHGRRGGVSFSLAKYPYKDAIVELDHRIGQLHAALERAGQLENTLLFITSETHLATFKTYPPPVPMR